MFCADFLDLVHSLLIKLLSCFLSVPPKAKAKEKMTACLLLFKMAVAGNATHYRAAAVQYTPYIVHGPPSSANVTQDLNLKVYRRSTRAALRELGLLHGGRSTLGGRRSLLY